MQTPATPPHQLCPEKGCEGRRGGHGAAAGGPDSRGFNGATVKELQRQRNGDRGEAARNPLGKSGPNSSEPVQARPPVLYTPMGRVSGLLLHALFESGVRIPSSFDQSQKQAAPPPLPCSRSPRASGPQLLPSLCRWRWRWPCCGESWLGASGRPAEEGRRELLGQQVDSEKGRPGAARTGVLPCRTFIVGSLPCWTDIPVAILGPGARVAPCCPSHDTGAGGGQRRGPMPVCFPPPSLTCMT